MAEQRNGQDGASGTAERSVAARTMLVIEQVVAAGEPVGPRGLARMTGMDRSAVSRLLQQLRHLGMLEQRDGGYVPGPRLYTMARALAAGDSLLEAARPILRTLVEQFNETCYVCQLQGSTGIYVAEEQCDHPVRYVVELGQPVPLHAGAAGRAMLSALSRDDARRLLQRAELARVTENTITDLDTLLAAAESDRARGYTVSISERIHGSASVAAPFFDATRTCQGSVVFSCPQDRLDRSRVPQIGATLAAAARALSSRLGHEVGQTVTR